MSYERLNLKNDDVLDETHLAHLEDGIAEAEGAWELINSIEFTEEVSLFDFTEDSDGNSFELKKSLLLMYFPVYTGSTTVPSYGFFRRNKDIRSLSYTSVIVPSTSQARTMAWLTVFNGSFYKEACHRTMTSGLEPLIGGNNQPTCIYNAGTLRDGFDHFCNTTAIGASGLFFEGCKLWLYGVRA